MEQPKGSMARAALLFLPAKLLEGVVGMFTLSYTAAALSYAAYDRFTTVNTVVVFANLLLLGWLVNTTTRYVGDYAGEREGARTFYSTGTLLWLLPNLLALAAALVLYAVNGSLLGFAALAMIASTSLYQATLGMLVQTGRRLASVLVSLAAAALKPAVMWAVCTALAGGGKTDRILPAVAGYALGELAAGLAAVLILRIPRFFSLRRYSGALARRFLAYGLPLLGVSLSVGLLNMADRFIIILFGADYGVYHANNTIPATVFPLLTVALMRAVYPAVLEGWRGGGAAAAKRSLDSGARMYVLLGLPAAAGLAGVAPAVSAFLYHGDPVYVAGAPVIAVAAFAMFFSGLNEYAIKTWELRARTAPVMQNALLAMAVKIAASLALLPALGFVGAALGSLLGFALYFILSAARARSTLLFSLSRRTVLSALGGALACALASRAACAAVSRPGLALAAAVPAGGAAYVLVLLAAGEIRGEIGLLRRKIRRSGKSL